MEKENEKSGDTLKTMQNSTYLKKTITEIRELMTQALRLRKIEKKYADFIITDYIEAQLEQKYTHGISKFLAMDEALKERKGSPWIEVKKKDYAVVNGNRELGHICAMYSIDVLEDLMKDNTIAMVGLSNSSRYGRLKKYGQRVAEKGYVGIIVNNGGPSAVTPYGGITPMLGTNPICFSFPKEGDPLVIDVSTAKEVWGEVRQAILEKREIPVDAFLDEKGEITHDPNAVNAVLPFGEDAKGYSFCLAIEILTGALIHSKMGKEVQDQYELGFVLIAIDPTAFGTLGDFKEEVERLCEQIRNSEAKGTEKVYVPGERSNQLRKEAVNNNEIRIDEECYQRLKVMSSSLETESTCIDTLMD